MIKRIRQAIDQLLQDEAPMIVRDGEETYTLTHRDVEDIQQACGCSEGEAKQRLADWIVERLGDKK